MTDAVERLVNLALFLGAQDRPVTAEGCRREVEGYDEHQDDAAFARMFERDKDTLRESGIVLEVSRDESPETYALDRDATFAQSVELSPDARSALLAAGAALSLDPAFPHGDALRTALLKLGATGADPSPALHAPTAPDAGVDAGATVATLVDAATRRKRARFAYRDAAGRGSRRTFEPFGLFLRAGSWYVVGRDTDKDALRTFAVRRMSDLSVESARPKTPDFDRPGDFDVADFVRLPFQYGPGDLIAELEFESETSWRAERLARGRGTLETREDGAVVWRVRVGDPDRLLGWIIEHGPGIRIAGPGPLVERLRLGIGEVTSHG